jgi:hypothetical protein
MSQSAAATKTAPRTAPRPAARPAARSAPRQSARLAAPAPRLRAVSAPRHTRSRAGLVVMCVCLLLVGLVGLLLLNVSLERGAYDLRDQSTRAEQLREQAQKVTLELRGLEAPDALAGNARRLGMVDAAPGVPFVLPDGRTLGVAQKATAPPSRTVNTVGPKVTASGKAAGAGKPTAGPTTGGKPTAGRPAAGTPTAKHTAAGTAASPKPGTAAVKH